MGDEVRELTAKLGFRYDSQSFNRFASDTKKVKLGLQELGNIKLTGLSKSLTSLFNVRTLGLGAAISAGFASAFKFWRIQSLTCL